MSFHWKSFLIGIVSLIGIPLTSFASTAPGGSAKLIATGVVATVHVGLKDAGWGFYITLIDQSGNETAGLALTSDMATGSYFPSILSVLMYSKASGNSVTLYNHTNASTSYFDEVVLLKQ